MHLYIIAIFLILLIITDKEIYQFKFSKLIKKYISQFISKLTILTTNAWRKLFLLLNNEAKVTDIRPEDNLVQNENNSRGASHQEKELKKNIHGISEYESRIELLQNELEKERERRTDSEKKYDEIKKAYENLKSSIENNILSPNREVKGDYNQKKSSVSIQSTPPQESPIQIAGKIFARPPYGNIFSHFSPVFIEIDTPFVISPSGNNEATYTLVDHPLTIENLFSMADRLQDACNFSKNEQSKVVDISGTIPGKLIKEGEHWRIVSKMTLDWK